MQKNYPEFDIEKIDRRMQMLRTDQYKLIQYDDGQLQVYDLAADPTELDDLSGSDAELASRLVGMLEEWNSLQETVAPPPSLDVTDPELREQLKALGYLE